MDSFGLAIQRIANHVNKLQGAVEQLAAKHGDVQTPSGKCKVCLPTEYAGKNMSAETKKTLEDGLIAEAMRTEIIPKLPYDRVCNLTSVPAELANAPWNN